MSEITTTLMGARRQITSAARHLPAARSAAGGDADADGFENGGDPANRALLTAAKVANRRAVGVSREAAYLGHRGAKPLGEQGNNARMLTTGYWLLATGY